MRQFVSSHTLLKAVALVAFVAVVSGCASTPPSNGQGDTATVNKDPYEGFNRTMFGFNHHADIYVLKPITQGYRYVTPDVVETGVSNFFSNLLEVRNILNAVLQGKGGKAANYTGRFLVNSTVGIGGLLDVAKEVGMEKTDGEDFGQTLGAWGVNSGPYLVLPLLGPSNIRDGVSIPVDMYADPVNYLESSASRTALDVLEVVDTRSKLLDTERLITGDKYIFIRDAYLQRRQYLVTDGALEETFSDEEVEGDF